MSSEAVGRNVSVDAALRTAVAIALVSAKRKRAAAAAAADGSQWKQQAEQLQLEALRLRESAAALFGAWRELRPLSQQQQQGGPDPLARQIEQAEEDQEAAEPVAAAKAGKKAKRGGRQRGSGRRATRPKADPRVNEAGAGPGQGAGPEAATGGDGGAAVSFIDTVADAGGAAAAWDGRAAAMAAVGEGLLALLGPTPLAGPMDADDPFMQHPTEAVPPPPGLAAPDPRVGAKARVLERLLGRMQALTNLATAAAAETETGAPGSAPSAAAAGSAAAAASSRLRSLLRPGRAGVALGARGQGGQQPEEADAGESLAVLRLYGRALQHGGALPHSAVLSFVADVLVAGELPGAGAAVGGERSGGRAGGGLWAAGGEGAGEGIRAAGRAGGGAVFAGLPPDVRRAHLRQATELLAALVHSLGCVAEQAQQQQQQGVSEAGGLPEISPGLTSSAPLAAREVLLCVSHDLGSHVERLLGMAGGGGSWSSAAGPQLPAATPQPPPNYNWDAAAAAREALSNMLRHPALGQHVLLGAARGVRGLGVQLGRTAGALAGTCGGPGGDPAAAAAGFGGLGSLRGAIVVAAATFSRGRTLFDVLADACGCVPQWCSAAPSRSQSPATSLAPEALTEALSCLLDAHTLGSGPAMCAAFPLYGSAVQEQLAGLAALLMHVATVPEFTGCSLVPVCRSLCARIKQSVLLPGAPAVR